jgi:hypothetical protein
MIVIQGRRASLRSPLAPGYHISRLWRSLPGANPAHLELIWNEVNIDNEVSRKSASHHRVKECAS